MLRRLRVGDSYVVGFRGPANTGQISSAGSSVSLPGLGFPRLCLEGWHGFPILGRLVRLQEGLGFRV